jgi:hypothetical protein
MNCPLCAIPVTDKHRLVTHLMGGRPGHRLTEDMAHELAHRVETGLPVEDLLSRLAPLCGVSKRKS